MAIDIESKKAFAQKLRDNPTESERILRGALLKKGYKFKFQSVVYGYIPDFYFPQHQKIVELDGKRFHNLAKDGKRDSDFHNYGIRTLRIRSHRVFKELDTVMRSIALFLNEISVHSRKRQARKKKIKKNTPAWAKVPKVKEIKGLRRMKK